MARTTGGADFARRLQPRHKVWLNWGGAFLMGPRYEQFLRAVERTGTIREAGRAVGWSYRTCLNRIRQMEAVLGAPVLQTTRGGAAHGGARLTPLARRLLGVFDTWRGAMRARSDAEFRRALRG
ncbi:MAG TPA: LysR family transcriptional regulator [Gemmatimonadales bacterium]|nr:LysR family transcriptional regulator [Gemmatimonadales bacterium]